MSEFNLDTSAEIERIFLWQEVVDVFRANAFQLGVQTSFESTSGNPTLLVLAETPLEEDDTLEMWGEVSANAMIGKVSLLFIDNDGREVFNYELTPSGIKQYASEPTPLDCDDIMDLRMDLADAKWDKQRSQECAEKLTFFS